MYLSRIQIRLNQLPSVMMEKEQYAGAYAWHQWLWQLFPSRDERFLFRREQQSAGDILYLLSNQLPDHQHNLFVVESKVFRPQLMEGMVLQYALRANPVVTRNGKRFDVMMDVKYQAKHNSQESFNPEPGAIRHKQEEAARAWLNQQSDKAGFRLDGAEGCQIINYQQHRLVKKDSQSPIQFSSVDYAGRLIVTQPEHFLMALRQGFGKCKGLGCGLMLIKKG